MDDEQLDPQQPAAASDASFEEQLLQTLEGLDVRLSDLEGDSEFADLRRMQQQTRVVQDLLVLGVPLQGCLEIVGIGYRLPEQPPLPGDEIEEIRQRLGLVREAMALKFPLDQAVILAGLEDYVDVDALTDIVGLDAEFGAMGTDDDAFLESDVDDATEPIEEEPVPPTDEESAPPTDEEEPDPPAPAEEPPPEA